MLFVFVTFKHIEDLNFVDAYAQMEKWMGEVG